MCTDFLLETGEGFVNGRSMEFGVNLHSRFFFRTEGHSYDQSPLEAPKKFGYTWTGKYSFVGMNIVHKGLELDFVADGMNTAGMSVGGLWLSETKYGKIKDPKKGLAAEYFVAWILSSFAPCKELKHALRKGEVQISSSKKLSSWTPQHCSVHDALGNSLVIEIIKGKIQIHDNPVRVLTNSPPFKWHLENLRDYTNLRAHDAGEMKFGSLNVKPPGHGSGLVGLPGDWLPTSRFVRAAMMLRYAYPVKTQHDGIILAFHILNAVDIPNGVIRYEPNLETDDVSDSTEWIAVKDLKRLIYFVRIYDSPLVYSIDLNKVFSTSLATPSVDGQSLVIPPEPISIDLSSQVVGFEAVA